jgi:hypothetical protein
VVQIYLALRLDDNLFNKSLVLLQVKVVYMTQRHSGGNNESVPESAKGGGGAHKVKLI